MKPLLPFSSSELLLLLVSVTLAALSVGCGASGNSNTSGQKFSGNTAVTILVTSTANDQLTEFDMSLQTLSLTSQSGTTVNIVAAPTGAEFIHLNGQIEPLTTVTIPQGIYTAGSATVGGAEFICNTLDPSGGIATSAFAYGYTPDSQVTVNLPSPITITGDTMGLLVTLPVLQSASFSTCFSNGAPDPYSITPTFDIAPVTLLSEPTNSGNGKVTGVEGQITAISAAGDGFTLSVPEADATSRSVSITTSSGVIYQGVSGFSGLEVGTFVDLDGAIQYGGSIQATRIAVEDPSAVDVIIGPLLYVSAEEKALYMMGRDQQGSDFSNMYLLGGQYFSFDSAVFQVSGAFPNLQSLPFVASFDGTNMVAGQNLYLSSPKLAWTSNPYTELDAITLIPQTVDATVAGVSMTGSFTQYTVSLAPYDLFPTFAAQQGQRTLLTNPGQVEVYVDNGTQLLNSQPLAVGSTFRFYGLVFNDNGTLRMDCAQVNDGVDFASSQSGSQLNRLETGLTRTVQREGLGGVHQTVTTMTR